MRTFYTIGRRLVTHRGIGRGVHLCAAELWEQAVENAIVPGRLPSNFRVRWATTDDLSALRAYYGAHAPITARQARGDVCLMAWCRDQLCAAVWLAPGPCHYREDAGDLRCLVDVPDATAWTYDGKGTRLGAWGTLMKQLPAFAHKRGIRRLTTMIDCDNWQSISGHKSLGYQHVGTVLHSRLWRVSVCRARQANSFWRRLPQEIGSVRLERPSPKTASA